MNPLYTANYIKNSLLEELNNTSTWENRTDARSECFMASPIRSYTYGSGKGVRTYTSIEPSGIVSSILFNLNTDFNYSFNACFLNRYDNQFQQLGWHADDSPGQDDTHPIAVISFGEEREIWWRLNGQTGIIPENQRQKLGNGSLFVMPGGMQQTHQHRIPKGSREMGRRISLTFRKFL
jgi:alkylated DNA repair dioxygenase AlkB